MNFPSLFKLVQRFKRPIINNIGACILHELERIQVDEILQPGQKIAITAGSRGISDIALILREIITYLKRLEAKPFIIPAMGSHGGGTANGQLQLLAHYGITEETMDVPILSSMEVVQIAKTPEGIPVFIDKNASQADWIVVVNRVKPHTDFSGDIESGILKMAAVGLGKKIGADFYHKAPVQHGYGHVMASVGRTALKEASIAFGVGLVENAYDETAYLEAGSPEDLEEIEKGLLIKAKQNLAKLPFEHIDLLIIDEIGKDISGVGMDSNVTGRALTIEKKIALPRVSRIFVRDLSAKTKGNANGLGLADFVTRRLVDKIDFQATYLNALTGMFPEAARIPMIFDSDRESIKAALNTIGNIFPKDSKIVWIKNTLILDNMMVSEKLREEGESNPNLDLLGDLGPMKFDEKGNLVSIL